MPGLPVALSVALSAAQSTASATPLSGAFASGFGASGFGQSGLVAQEDGALFLGEDFFPWMVLAFGAAMVVGNVLAMVRPPAEARDDPARRPPVGRSLVLIGVGLAAAAWGLASLLS